MKSYRNLLIGVLVLTMLVTFFQPFKASANDGLADAQAELNRIRQQMNQLQQSITSNQRQSASVLGELERLDREIQQAEQQIQYTETRLQAVQQEISVTEKELAEAEANLAFRNEALKTRLRALYERGSVSYLEMLLDARSFSDFVNRIFLLQQIVNQDVVIVEAVKAERARIEEHKVALETRRTELTQLHNEAVRQRNVRASRAADRTQALNSLRNERAQVEQAYAELEQFSNELNKLIAEMLKHSGGTIVGSGTYTWPTPGYTWITSRFGWRRHPIFGNQSFHNGIDIGAPMGATIVAADHGTVLYAGWLGGYGQTVIIDHGRGITTLYAHCSVLLVREGQAVTKGQAIARIGSTGWSTGPHLHFEVRVNDKQQDPLNYVRP